MASVSFCPEKHPTVGRDHENKRHGTLSNLASLDLHDGHVVATQMEKDLAEDLRRAGYTVTGGH
jgi:hypothetical protein